MQDDMTQEEINAILKSAMEKTSAAKPEADPAKPQSDQSPADTEQAPKVDGETSEGAAINQEQVNTDIFQPVSAVTRESSRLSAHDMEETQGGAGNISFLLDIPLNVSVELGRTNITIKDMLQLGPGSVIELDKLIGEPVDLLVNDKPIAKGEVVVFDENFGIRITDIINSGDRLKSLG